MKMVWEACGRCTDVPFCISLTFRSKLKARISQNQKKMNNSTIGRMCVDPKMISDCLFITDNSTTKKARKRSKLVQLTWEGIFLYVQ